jgi:hypothetical protein
MNLRKDCLRFKERLISLDLKTDISRVGSLGGNGTN